MERAEKALKPEVAVRPLSPSIGGEVEGVDLSRPMSHGTFAQIYEAFLEHCVLLFRSQKLTPEQQIAFSRRFGDLEEHVVSQYLLPGYPEIFILSNIVEDGRKIGSTGRRAGVDWHTDLSYMKEPSLGSLLYCLECPPGEGDTEFASMYAAYEALPEEKKRWLEGMKAVHDLVYHLETFMPDREPLTEEQKAKAPPVVHPAVRTHPETGHRALYVNYAVVSHFEGMDVEESRRILRELTAFAAQPQFVYRHRWQPDDLVIWDNRCTMHHLTGYDVEKYRRLMHRTTVKGDRPFLTA